MNLDIALPFQILGANLLAAVLVVILKDLANHVVRGETQLVLENLSSDPCPVRAETPYVEVSGRRAGLVGYGLMLLDMSPNVRLTASAREVRKTIFGLQRHTMEAVPFSESVSVRAEAKRSLIWLGAAILSLIVGVPLGLLGGDGFAQKVMNATAWLAASAVYLFAYFQSHVFQITVQGSIPIGVSFKPSVIEGQMVHFHDVIAAAEVLMQRVHQSRSIGVPVDAAAFGPQPVSAGSYEPPLPQPAELFEDDETDHQPAEGPPEQEGTGTVEYGDESPAFDGPPSDWEGSPEPGTPDSIHLRRSIARSESGMYQGIAHVLDEVEDEAPVAGETDHTGATHRGTVSWEEHADTTQDEMRAESELDELKHSRPRRGEARQRLRELMRRFPQTQAAKKAQRMLERLDSSQ